MEEDKHLTTDELLKLLFKERSLGLMWMELPDLSGIAGLLPNAQAVTLQHSFIPDLSQLADLPHLKAVYVTAEQEVVPLRPPRRPPPLAGEA